MKSMFLQIIILSITTALSAMMGYGTAPIATLDNTDPSLALTGPNGGEILYAGETTPITWAASDWYLPPAAVQIWFSPNGGGSYQLVTAGTNNSGSFAWEIPELETSDGLIRIRATDSQGNYTEQVSASTFSIIYAPPAAPQFVTAMIVNQADALISWQPVTQTVTSDPITPDGYLIFHALDPSAEDQYTLLATVSQGCSYTHMGIIQSQARAFYRVLAFKDYDSRVQDLLSKWEVEPKPGLTLPEFLRITGGQAGGAR
jgi:hypothetical protein